MNDNHSKDACDVTSYTVAAKPAMTAEARQEVLKEDCAQGKTARRGVRSLNKIFPVEKRNDDLVAQAAFKYGLEKARAERERGCVAEGRSYLTLDRRC